MKMRKIEILFPDDHISVTAILLDEDAPNVCKKIWNSLPLCGVAHHGIYSGSEIACRLKNGPIIESGQNQTSWLLPGEMAYGYFREKMLKGLKEEIIEFCWSYGRDTHVSMAEGPVLVSHFATIDQGLEELIEISYRMRNSAKRRVEFIQSQ